MMERYKACIRIKDLANYKYEYCYTAAWTLNQKYLHKVLNEQITKNSCLVNNCMSKY